MARSIVFGPFCFFPPSIMETPNTIPQIGSGTDTRVAPETSAETGGESAIVLTAQCVARHYLGRQLSRTELEDVCVEVNEAIDVYRKRGRHLLHGSEQENSRSKITPPELARRWGISPDKVLTWIRSGELRAIDTSATRGGRPRYLIDLQDIQAFEARRAVQRPVRVQRRRRTSDDEVLKYF